MLSMLDFVPLILGFIGILAVYFYYSFKIMRLYDQMGQPIPSPPPFVATARLTLAFMKIFSMEIQVEGRTKEEKLLVEELAKTVRTARMILVLSVALVALYFVIEKIVK